MERVLSSEGLVSSVLDPICTLHTNYVVFVMPHLKGAVWEKPQYIFSSKSRSESKGGVICEMGSCVE